MCSKMKVIVLISSIVCANFGAAKSAPNFKNNTNQETGATLTQSQSSKTVLSLNVSGHSELFHKLRQGFKLVDITDTSNQSKQTTSDLIQQSDIIYLDGMSPLIPNKQLNKILESAMDQEKTILLENTQYFDAQILSAMPFIAKGDVVVIKPKSYYDSDRIFVYGGSTMESISQEQDQLTFTDNKLVLTYYTDLLDRSLKISELNALSFEDKQQVFTDIADKISQNLDNQDLESIAFKNPEDEGIAALKTGGAIGYLCPASARQARLCWAAIVTNQAYRHVSGEADINILHHYSVAQYRTDQATTIAISTHGSANPNMKVDTSTKKAYYLEYVESEIKPYSTNSMALWSRTPQNRVNDGSITSTTGMTYGITGSGSDLGGSISYSESQSISMNITDWASNTYSPDGVTAKWIFQLNYPKSISDWVTQKTFQKAKFRSVPGISKYGLQYTTEGIWVGSKDLTGTFAATMKTKVNNNQLWFTKNTIFQWAASRNGWVHTLTDGSYSFNNGWLKDI